MDAPGEDSELLDISEAAEFLGVSEGSLRRWTNAGRLACLRVGGRRERRFRRQDLLAFLERQPVARASTTTPAPRGVPHDAVKAGVSLPAGTHLATLYKSDGGRVSQASDFLADALRPGVASFVVARPEARAELIAHLERSLGSLRAAIQKGQLALTDFRDSKQAQWEYFETAFSAAKRAGAKSLRLVGDMEAFARLITPEELVAFEAGLEHSIAGRFPLVMLCQYDVRRFSALEVLSALQGHPDDFRYPIERLIA